MRVRVWLCFFLAAAVAGYGKTVKPKSVPAPVITSFQKSFPEAENAQWKFKKGRYKVKFDMGGVRMHLVLDPGGAILERETKAALSDLPAGYKEPLAAKYPGYVVAKVFRREGEGVAGYKVTLTKKKKIIKVVLDASGRMIEGSKDLKVEKK